MKGRNQRLHNADSSVIGARVAPRFEIMRLVQMPVAKLGCFVMVQAKVNSQWSVAVLQSVFKSEVRGSVVHRIAAENKQHLDAASLHVADKLFQRVIVIAGENRYGISVENSFADIAELLVDSMAKR